MDQTGFMLLKLKIDDTDCAQVISTYILYVLLFVIDRHCLGAVHHIFVLFITVCDKFAFLKLKSNVPCMLTAALNNLIGSANVVEQSSFQFINLDIQSPSYLTILHCCQKANWCFMEKQAWHSLISLPLVSKTILAAVYLKRVEYYVCM